MILKETKILKVNPDLRCENDLENLNFAADVLKKGGLVAFPTETVYGLGANALLENAVKSIFEAKGRAQDNPLIVHVSKSGDINKYAIAENNKMAELLLPLLPAPLTVILPKRENIPLTVTAGLDSVAMRVPDNKVARKLIELSGVPVAAPSANLSGKPSPTSASHVIDDMMGRADVIIDSGVCEVGLESTVVTLCKETPTLLRPGGFTYEKLCDILGEVDISDAVLSKLKEGQKPESPGMKYKHYAPKTKVVLLKGAKQKVKEFIEQKICDKANAFICFEDDVKVNDSRVIFVGCRENVSDYAQKMFDALRKTDKIEGLGTVYATLPENTDGIGLAIYNRMLRAAGFDVIEL